MGIDVTLLAVVTLPGVEERFKVTTVVTHRSFMLASRLYHAFPSNRSEVSNATSYCPIKMLLCRKNSLPPGSLGPGVR